MLSVKQEISKNTGVKYFAEATIAKKADPVGTAIRRLKNGFKTGGMSIDMKNPPIWSELNNLTRNIRYKMHSWVMLDTLLSADEKSKDKNHNDNNINDLHNLGPNVVLPSINHHWQENTTSSSYQINDKPSFMSILFMDKDEGVFSYSPYRQIFMGVSGSLLDDKFDFSVGFDSFNHISEWGQGSSSGMNRYIYDIETLQFFEDDYWSEIEEDYNTLFDVYSSFCSDENNNFLFLSII